MKRTWLAMVPRLAILAAGLGLLICSAPSGQAAEPLSGRVLFIGIDGCRFDCVEKADTPQLHHLLRSGCYSDRTLILGSRYRGNDTVSGPGWSSLLTGVWADKHGVDNNRFERPHYDRFPHFFRYVKQAAPQAQTVSLADWPPIAERIVAHADINESPPQGELYLSGDEQTAARAAELLLRTEPTVLFVYFGQVDEHGHKFGFSPEVPEYLSAIQRVDKHVGQVLEALHRRPKFVEENWLVLVSSDHGGQKKGHGNGHQVPEILHSFVMISGAAAARGKLEQPTFLVDVPCTALVHLGIPLDAKWDLDGHAIGLREK